jgi:signal transduction histidine kinase
VQGATNSSQGSEPGAALEITILPPWWNTWWFRTAYALVALLVIWSVYRYRMRQIAEQFNIRIDAQVNERTRIARELHDTLLQSFQGAAFQFQAARRLLLRNADNAMQVVDEAIHAAEQGIQEGRTTIGDLRPEPAAQRNLPELVNAACRELASAQELNGRAISKWRFVMIRISFGCASAMMARESTRRFLRTADGQDIGVYQACASGHSALDRNWISGARWARALRCS